MSKNDEIREMLANKLLSLSSLLVKSIEKEENFQFVINHLVHITNVKEELIATLDNDQSSIYENSVYEGEQNPHERVEVFSGLTSNEVSNKIKQYKETTLENIKEITDPVTRKRILK